jgi:hypothetical protein
MEKQEKKDEPSTRAGQTPSGDSVGSSPMGGAPPPQKPEQMVIHKNSNAPLVGAIIFLAVVIGAAAYYVGTKKPASETVMAPTPIPASPTSQQPSPIVSPTNDVSSWQSYSSLKMKDLSFPGYTISYPADWVKSVTRDDITDTLTLKKGVYEIKIYQAPTGGSQCVFEGEIPEGPASDYRKTEFVEIKAGDITLRRVLTASGPGGKTAYSLCSNNPNSKTSFGTPTIFGHISFSAYSKEDATLLEMDKIVSTLKSSN